MKELQADMSRLCVSLGDSNQSPSQPEEPLQVAMPVIEYSHLILTRPPYKTLMRDVLLEPSASHGRAPGGTERLSNFSPSHTTLDVTRCQGAFLESSKPAGRWSSLGFPARVEPREARRLGDSRLAVTAASNLCQEEKLPFN